LGLGGDFDYRKCCQCGALSLTVVPADLARYYGLGYYSFGSRSRPIWKGWRRWESNIKNELSTGQRLNRSAGRVWRHLALGLDARVLDVGCGDGKWLHELHHRGYKCLSGIDFFLEPELERTSPFPIHRKSIEDELGGWDLISYHHVLEHVADPAKEIAAARARLRPGGCLLVRIPVADSWARYRFGTCWVQWDAPRHLWLPTRLVLRQLAQAHDLTVEYEADESTAFSLWASAGYEKGFSGFDHELNPFRGTIRTYLLRLPNVIWYWIFSAWLNFRSQGDQVTMIWRKPA
jgi:SAM-dependent methyltransferase